MKAEVDIDSDVIRVMIDQRLNDVYGRLKKLDDNHLSVSGKIGTIVSMIRPNGHSGSETKVTINLTEREIDILFAALYEYCETADTDAAKPLRDKFRKLRYDSTWEE